MANGRTRKARRVVLTPRAVRIMIRRPKAYARLSTRSLGFRRSQAVTTRALKQYGRHRIFRPRY